MRLAISTSNFYHADIYCADSRSAKKILREKSVSIVALDFYLAGRETGSEVIRWAKTHGVLPSYVVVIERDLRTRQLIKTFWL